ncbi:Acyl-CoA synthetase [Rhodococcus sp. RD6.2]|uniref:AMP-binding protein n=1 Tax=Rhodococcus sp. RD6.2 TaxID=260936 RepID=UPI00063B4C2C|nr:AMP-binding protein [Rhodococcus sp. RD6.2]CRK52987.1 Acyl-CoA synthetase [Rhodococcus sp. RD6.2]
MIDFPDTHADAEPGRPAYVMAETGTVVTYRELVDASRSIAALLASRGLRHGDCIAVLMENSADFPKIAWAAQRSGLRYVTLSTRLLPDEIAYILSDSGARALITSERHLAAAAEAAERTEVVEHRFTTGDARSGFESLAEAVASVPAGTEVDEREGVDLLYSSGTTGRPKGVKAALPLDPIGTPPGVAGLLHDHWGIDRDSVYLSPAPLYHAAPLRFTMTVHRYGGTAIVMERFDAERALDLVERHRVTHTQMVPTMFIRILKLPEPQRTGYDLSSLQVVIHAAAPCPQDTKRAMIDWLGPIVHEYYSSTENSLFTALDSAQWLAHPGSVGRSILGTAHILDEAGRELPPGETGTIWSDGGLLFEYLNDPEKTAGSRNEQGWTTVGDLGYLDQDGFLYLSDRRADLILSGGVNIYPREAEDVLVVHPKVADAAVFGIPHDELGEVVHAVVQPIAGVAPDDTLADELLAYCREHLAAYKCPRRIDFEAELPRHATGKLYKRLLRDRYSQPATR